MEGYITDQEIHQDLLDKIYNNKEFESLEGKVSTLMNKLDTMKDDMVIENKGNVTRNDVLEGKTFLNGDNKLESGSIKTIEKTFDIGLEFKAIDIGYYTNSKIKGLNNYSEDDIKDMVGKYIKNNGNTRKTFIEKLIKEMPKDTLDIIKNALNIPTKRYVMGEELVTNNILTINSLEFKPSKIIVYGNYHDVTFIHNNTETVNYLMYDSDTEVLFEVERYKEKCWVQSNVKTTFTNTGFTVYINKSYRDLPINLKYIIFE